MRVKICGLTDPENAHAVGALGPDYAGLIFYGRSPRAVDEHRARDLTACLPAGTTAVGVFVDEDPDTVLVIASRLGLRALQLHGESMLETAGRIRDAGYKGEIFGAVPGRSDSVAAASAYSSDILTGILFDTPSALHGGSGATFDWGLIDSYTGTLPFFLSGGIGLENIDQALSFSHPRLYGVDLNSRVEISAGIKNIQLVKNCMEKARYVHG